MKQTRILSIVWYKVLPARFGGQKGIAHFNEALGKLFPLVCLCSRNNEPSPELSYKVIPELPISKWQFLNPFIHQKIISVAKKENPTHIILEHPYHATAAIKACKATGAKLIAHSHNIESQRYRQLEKKGWQLLYKQEKRLHQHADLSLFKTPEEMEYGLRYYGLLPEKCMVMPYGIQRPENINKHAARKLIFDRHNILPDSQLFLFAGTLDYAPNARAVEAIYSQIATQLKGNFKVIICGRNRIKGFEYLHKLAQANVIMAGEVVDIENYFAAADLFINPVMSGGGVQTKNLDALSYDLNLVCYDDMLSGIDLSLCGDKVFAANRSMRDAFTLTINKAREAPSNPTPNSFFDHYSFDSQVLKLAERIKFTV